MVRIHSSQTPDLCLFPFHLWSYVSFLCLWVYFYFINKFIFIIFKKISHIKGKGNGNPLRYSFAWKIPWTEEPGRPQSMGSLRVGHDWGTSLWLFTFMHWRRKWQPTPVFLPGESQGRGSLVGCRLCCHTESDTTEVTYQQQQQQHI